MAFKVLKLTEYIATEELMFIIMFTIKTHFNKENVKLEEFYTKLNKSLYLESKTIAFYANKLQETS